MIKQIEYENKQAIQNDDSIANKNKVTAEDMNEIKNVVNQNAKELEILQEDNQGNETAIETLQNDISLIKQNNSEQDKSIQSNTSKIEAINKSIEAINKKNTEQDTNIQKNAKDIEANQNNIKDLQVENAEVKAENERLRSDIESISLIGEAEGESIDLDDSSGARFKKFGVSGNHSQETREGYNIVDLTSFPKGARNGITATVDLNKGSITLNGTCTGTFAYAIPLALNAGTVVSYGLNNLQTNSEVTMRFEVTDNTQEGQISCAQKNAKMENFALTKDTVSWQLRIGKGTVLTDFVIYPQIEVGSTLHKFETYGATPSLEIPSEIKTVKDNVNIVVCNKNKLKLTEISEIPGISVSKNNGKLVLNGTATSTNDGIKIGTFYAKKDETYILSITNKISGFGVNLNNNKVGIAENLINITESSTATVSKAAIATDNGKVDVYIAINKDTVFNNFEVEIQIEENTTATSIIEHQEQAITMPTQQEMLKEDYFDWENEKEVHNWNKLILTEKAQVSYITIQNDYVLFQVTPSVNMMKKSELICNCFKNEANWLLDKESIWYGGPNNQNIQIKILSSRLTETTVQGVKEWLKSKSDDGNPVIVYYKTTEPTELLFTDEQKVVAKKKKETLHTYKNVTHIYSTDETSPIMNVEYAKDLNTQNNNLQNQIDEIKQLISTTQTSAMLLDNLQKEVESEVE